MDFKTKLKITTKISKLDKKKQFLNKNCYINDTVKKAINKELKKKKKVLTQKINKGQQRGFVKRLVKVMCIFSKLCLSHINNIIRNALGMYL